MSDADSCDNNAILAEQDNICRDYLRNACHRGQRCKYLHPGPKEANETGLKINFIFCHDFQNKECHRPNCKFVHCSKAEEREYFATGILPQCIVEAIGRGGGLNNSNIDSDIPVCLDYLKGVCHRRGHCKYRHVSQIDYGMEMRMGRQSDSYAKCNAAFEDYKYFEPERMRSTFDDFENNTPVVRQTMQLPVPLPADYYVLEEENAFMRRKMMELQKQVANLSTANEFLFDQNAQLRLSKQTVVASVTQTLNPNSMAATSSSVPPSIAQISQQLPLNSDLTAATQSSLQPACMPQELTAAANPPTMTPMVPVSLSASAMAPVSISSVSLTQAIPAASLAQSLPQNSLVSYPIITQSMRPAIQQSSLAH